LVFSEPPLTFAHPVGQILHGLKGAFLATLLGSEVLQTLGIALMQLEDLLAAFWGYMEQDIFI
jgi:hypothetical protein